MGKGELARGTLQQPCAELSLELLNAPAQRVGRHPKLARRFGKAAVAHHVYKQGDVVQVKHASATTSLNGLVHSNYAI